MYNDTQTFDYTSPNFDITNIPDFNGITGLIDISKYLDFSISTTIRKQLPNINEYQEKELAKEVLNGYMSGNNNAFTSKFEIRHQIVRIGRDKLVFLFLKTLIEKWNYSETILRKLIPTDTPEEYSKFVSDMVYSGKTDSYKQWISDNISTFIDIYVQESYGKTSEQKKQLEELCYANPTTTRTLEQLNLEMSLSRLKS